jgi:uncharacterized protein YlzI (FlbEa/FlbD family)
MNSISPEYLSTVGTVAEPTVNVTPVDFINCIPEVGIPLSNGINKMVSIDIDTTRNL